MKTIINSNRINPALLQQSPRALDKAQGALYTLKTRGQKHNQRFYRKSQIVAKRLGDIVISSGALLALSPLLTLTVLAIRLDSKGPAFFSQMRVGKNAQAFKMWKFRSMSNGSEKRHSELTQNNEMSGGVIFKMKADPRVTRVGRFIRKYSIDELPQLWNVLKGDMALVGPRPALAKEVAQYSLKDRQRLSLKPGITCLWQISGRSTIPFEQQVELDRQYACETSIMMDIKILLSTIPAVLAAKGAY